jgi:cephalosporin hydroxylase
MYTREEFETLRRKWAEELAADKKLLREALEVLIKADRHNWLHQTNWLGEPILQLPQDIFALQEIIFKTRPQYIVEIGVAWGGSLLFYATLMQALGGERIIWVDIFIPEDLKARIGAFGALSKRISWILGSSVEAATFNQVKALLHNSREVMVVLDSHHTHEHVLQELRLYAPLVGKGYYLVCCDTIIEDIPAQIHRPRPWGPGNNPKTAVQQFLAETDRFTVDQDLENKLLFTCNPGGYLRCLKD